MTHTDEQIATAAADIARACDDADAAQGAGRPHKRLWADAYARVKKMEREVPPEQLRRVLG